MSSPTVAGSRPPMIASAYLWDTTVGRARRPAGFQSPRHEGPLDLAAIRGNEAAAEFLGIANTIIRHVAPCFPMAATVTLFAGALQFGTSFSLVMMTCRPAFTFQFTLNVQQRFGCRFSRCPSLGKMNGHYNFFGASATVDLPAGPGEWPYVLPPPPEPLCRLSNKETLRTAHSAHSAMTDTNPSVDTSRNRRMRRPHRELRDSRHFNSGRRNAAGSLSFHVLELARKEEVNVSVALRRPLPQVKLTEGAASQLCTVAC
uniref:Uncharacterized protein n=1 Tax=Trichuris muris TaxID=70415 RepID=A0A5S6QJI0_TRIMR